jgi:hypothetical protein
LLRRERVLTSPTIQEVEMAETQVCSIPDCGKPVSIIKRGWCTAHYKRWRRHGDPMGGTAATGEAMRYYNEIVLPYDGDECLLWPYLKTPAGYGRMYVRPGRIEVVSRLLCREANGEPPTSKHDAAHSCGKGHLGCVTKRHLQWKTQIENAADKLLHGTDGRGEKHPLAKLTEAQVREIRAATIPQKTLAAKFGVNRSTICQIKSGQRWGWLT